MKKEKSNPYRLAADIRPTHYKLKLEPDLEKFVFRGTETIAIEAVRAFKQITLHSADIRIRKAVLRAQDAVHENKKITYDAKFETATIHFGETLAAGKAGLDIEFEGTLNDKMHGFYRTSYQVRGEKKWGAATQFEATDARRAFPCFDEPEMKARFDVTLKVPAGLTALSNMPIKERARDGNLEEIHYETSPVMSTYLLCFVIAELEYLQARDKNGVWIRVYTTPEKKEQGRFALDVALHTLPYFAEWFNIPYCLPKLDMVALPDFASGAMENWGLVTYRETTLLIDAENSSAQARQRVAEVIDHELAHQWFGNLVTMEWWTDLWLNEGFASYMGPKAVAHQFPEWNVWDQFLIDDYLLALRDDSLKNSHPIEIPVKNPHEIREIFDHITYSKGSSVNRMLDHYLGEADFRKGLSVYLKRYAYKNANTGDLWKTLEEVSGKPVKSIMDSYTRQEGYPVLTVQPKPGKKRALTLRQSRFLFDGSADTKHLTWKLPVGVIAEGMKQTDFFFMKGKSAVVALTGKPGGWVKLNPGQSGFFRVAYTPALLARLSSAAASGALSVADCLGVLDDAFALARAGSSCTSAALDLARGCQRQKDYNIWITVAGILGSVENVLTSEDDKRRFDEFGRGLFARPAAAAGWEKKPSDSHLDVLLRALAIARSGHYGDRATLGEVRKRFAAFLENGKLDPSLRSAVYSLVAEYGAENEYEKLRGIYLSSDLQEEKVRVLRALTRFKTPNVIRKVLEFSLSPEVRLQDKYAVLAGFGSNPQARQMNWEFVKAGWPQIVALYSGGSVGLLGHILEGASVGFSDEETLKDVAVFFKSHPVPGTERRMKQSLEVIRANTRWRLRDTKDISAWLLK